MIKEILKYFNLEAFAFVVFRKLGLGGVSKLYKNPTPEMANTKRFFDDRTSEVEKIIASLCDEKSKLVYAQIIKYRFTYDQKYAQIYSTNDSYFPKDIITKRCFQNAVFIDCGAFDGDTIRKFVKLSKKYIGGVGGGVFANSCV